MLRLILTLSVFLGANSVHAASQIQSVQVASGPIGCSIALADHSRSGDEVIKKGTVSHHLNSYNPDRHGPILREYQKLDHVLNAEDMADLDREIAKELKKRQNWKSRDIYHDPTIYFASAADGRSLPSESRAATLVRDYCDF